MSQPGIGREKLAVARLAAVIDWASSTCCTAGPGPRPGRPGLVTKVVLVARPDRHHLRQIAIKSRIWASKLVTLALFKAIRPEASHGNVGIDICSESCAGWAWHYRNWAWTKTGKVIVGTIARLGLDQDREGTIARPLVFEESFLQCG